jgi:acyl-CoA synthetase (AMP-forming)/AMP-acid ligase II
VALAGPDGHDYRECVGRLRPGVSVDIIDQNGAPLPAGEIGEIRIKAPGVVRSYYANPEETALRLRDGWFYPGDLASMTEDGQLIIHGRRDDMMIMNSINIFPAEIERAMEAHPEVTAAVAFPIRSGTHGEIPAVAIELKAGSRLTEQELARYSRDKLGLRCPRRVIIVAQMPRNPLGKVSKNAIAETLQREAKAS